MRQAAKSHITQQRRRRADTELLELGRQAAVLEAKLDSFDNDPRDEIQGYDEMMETHETLLRRIAATPARTIDDLRVKAQRILNWRKSIPAEMSVDPDEMLAESIARDLLAIEGVFALS